MASAAFFLSKNSTLSRTQPLLMGKYDRMHAICSHAGAIVNQMMSYTTNNVKHENGRSRLSKTIAHVGWVEARFLRRNPSKAAGWRVAAPKDAPPPTLRSQTSGAATGAEREMTRNSSDESLFRQIAKLRFCIHSRHGTAGRVPGPSSLCVAC
jgi:hypothetical protein